MPKGTITTRTIRATPDELAVEVTAHLDAGDVLPGMFIHIPMNGLVLTVPIDQVTHSDDGIRIVIDCQNDPAQVNMILAWCGYEDQTFEVLDTGEA